MNSNAKISFAIADDHAMLRKGLIKLLSLTGDFDCLFDVENGDEVITQLRNHKIPDILILDINMAIRNGHDTALWVNRHYPQVKILALSMFDDETAIIKMIHSGAKGYITKHAEPEKLIEAITSLHQKGSYLPESLSGKILSGIKNNLVVQDEGRPNLTDREKEFLLLLCKELSYAEIASKMYLSPQTIHDYRRKLALKLGVKGKSGLIVYAMNNGLN